MLLEEAKIWEHVEKEIATSTNPKKLVAHVKKEGKAKRNILDSLKSVDFNCKHVEW
jgi:hypothetical protein